MEQSNSILSLFPKYPSSSSSSCRKWVGPNPHGDEGAHHFLDSCYLCKSPIGAGRDIYMYRGDTPFCSEECRQEQIDVDEAKGKRLKMSRKQQQQQQKSKSKSPSKSDKIHLRVSGTVVAG